MRSVQVVPFEAELHARAVADVYRSVFTEPPWNEDAQQVRWFAEEWFPYATTCGGFRCYVANDGDSVVGFTFGLIWNESDDWCAAASSALRLSRLEHWIDDCFYLVELAVREEYRGRGVGGKLHDQLMSEVTNRTAVLSTNRLGPPAAAALYAKRGWRIILENWSPWEGAEPVHLLGLNRRPQ